MAVSSEETKYSPNFAAMVSRTLEEVAESSPIPKLAEAAQLALQIATTVGSTIENTEGDRHDFDLLAAQARAFVYLIFVANQNVQKEDDSQPGLMYDFDWALAILSDINEFAAEYCITKRITPLLQLFLNDNENIQSFRMAFWIYLDQYRNWQATGIYFPTLVNKLIIRRFEPHWRNPKNFLMSNDINRTDKVMNDYHGMDFAWTSGIRLGSNNNNIKMVQRSS